MFRRPARLGKCLPACRCARPLPAAHRAPEPADANGAPSPAACPPSFICRYDPQSNRWLPGPPLQHKRFALGGAALDGALYAVGGHDGTSYLDSVERLDPRTDR